MIHEYETIPEIGNADNNRLHTGDKFRMCRSP